MTRFISSLWRVVPVLAKMLGRHGCLLRGQSVEEQARSLTAAYPPADWLQAPFTRCVSDNCLLHPAPPDGLAEVPPGARGLTAPLTVPLAKVPP